MSKEFDEIVQTLLLRVKFFETFCTWLEETLQELNIEWDGEQHEMTSQSDKSTTHIFYITPDKNFTRSIRLDVIFLANELTYNIYIYELHEKVYKLIYWPTNKKLHGPMSRYYLSLKKEVPIVLYPKYFGNDQRANENQLLYYLRTLTKEQSFKCE